MLQTIFRRLPIVVILPLSVILLTGCTSLDKAKDLVSDDSSSQITTENPVSRELTLEVIDQNNDSILKNIEFNEGESLYEILNAVISEPGDLEMEFTSFEFDGKESFFVKSINGYDPAADNSFWSFKVNGELSSVGISDYIPANGDKILFELETIN